MMMTCNAFAGHGLDVTLVAPRVWRSDWSVKIADIWPLYCMKPSFRVLELPTFVWEETIVEKTLRYQQLLLAFLLFAWHALKDMFQPSKQRETLIYAKCYTSIVAPILIRAILRKKWTICFEKPDFDEKKWLHRFVCTKSDAIVATTPAVVEGLVNHYGLSRDRIIDRPYYSWINIFSPESDKAKQAQMRERHGMDPTAFTVFYGGKVTQESTEVADIVRAAAQCDQQQFVIAGMPAKTEPYYQALADEVGAKNITFKGFKPVHEFYEMAQASDLLVSYYDTKHFSAHHKSAAKLMLYLCAEKPIILSDVPNLRRLMSEDCIYFVTPEESDKLAEAIKKIAASPDQAAEKAGHCIEFARDNDALKSTAKILSAIDQVKNS